ncbi:MAG: peptide deformylase [Clostridiales bacterium]|jgi:peptide deformylase|nr:peptide deformylase [Clostridiales bacterium]
MAIRRIMLYGQDDILMKISKPVDEINDKILNILYDMIETMNEADGVGLAAPQVGLLKRICIVKDEKGEILKLINPIIIEKKGNQNGYEGCLSVPQKRGKVKRANIVVIKAQDENGIWREIVGKKIVARAFEHEIDHLDGKLFVDMVTKWSDR